MNFLDFFPLMFIQSHECSQHVLHSSTYIDSIYSWKRRCKALKKYGHIPKHLKTGYIRRREWIKSPLCWVTLASPITCAQSTMVLPYHLQDTAIWPKFQVCRHFGWHHQDFFGLSIGMLLLPFHTPRVPGN